MTRGRLGVLLAAAAVPAAAMGQGMQSVPPPPGYEHRMEPQRLDERPQRSMDEQDMRIRQRWLEDERWESQQRSREEPRGQDQPRPAPPRDQRFRDDQQFRVQPGSQQREVQFRDQPHRDSQSPQGLRGSRRGQGRVWTMDDWYGPSGTPTGAHSSNRGQAFSEGERQERLRWEPGVSSWSGTRAMDQRSGQSMQRPVGGEQPNRIRAMQEPRQMREQQFRDEMDRPQSRMQGQMRPRHFGLGDGSASHQPGSWGPDRVRVKANSARPNRQPLRGGEQYDRQRHMQQPQWDSRQGQQGTSGRIYGTGEPPPPMIDDDYQDLQPLEGSKELDENPMQNLSDDPQR